MFNENQYISIQISCSLFYIIFKTWFAINPDLVLVLSYHFKELFISHISQLSPVITFQRGHSGIIPSPIFLSSNVLFCFHEISKIHLVTQKILNFTWIGSNLSLNSLEVRYNAQGNLFLFNTYSVPSKNGFKKRKRSLLYTTKSKIGHSCIFVVFSGLR